MSDLEHQKRKFRLARGHLRDPDADVPSYTDSALREENEDRLLALVMGGALPWRSAYHPEGYSDTWGLHGDYWLQLFFSTAGDVVGEDLGERGVLRKRAGCERALEQGRGKSSATDGSKGQWETALRHRARACDWFLGEWDGTGWMDDGSLSRAPEGWGED